MVRKRTLACAAAVLVLEGLVPAAHAAECCTISAINLRTGVVTAEDPAKRRFHVLVNNAVLIHRLQVGQAVDVDEQNRRATFAGIAGRFSLVDDTAPRVEEPRVTIITSEPPAMVAPAAPPGRVAEPALPPVSARQPQPSYGAPAAPAPAAPQARAEAAPPAPAADPGPPGGRALAGGRRDPRAVDPPNDDANEDDEPDSAKPQRGLGPRMGRRGAGGGKLVRLDKYPDAGGFLKKVGDAFTRKEIDVALLGGEKYMINSCLGIKVSAGGFRMKLASPNARIEGTAAKLTFRINHISLNGVSLRMRPNSNVLKPCHFSKKFSVGGAASDVRVEFRFDPLLDLAQCKLGSVGDVRVRVDVGNLNLKPLQNDLDRIAKNMIEDAVNYAFEADPLDQVIQTIDDVLELDCPGKRAQAG